MGTRRSFALSVRVALVVLLLAAAHSPGFAAQKWRASMLVGYWYGEGYQPYMGRNEEWISNFRPDGTFKITFRWSRDCKTFQTQSEGGVWDFDRGITTMITTSMDGANISPGSIIRDRYEMKKLTAHRRVYLHRETGTVFSTRRVAADFKFPRCRLKTPGIDR